VLAAFLQQNAQFASQPLSPRNLQDLLKAKDGAADALLQEDQPSGLDVENKEAHGYEFQSGGVVGMLEQLKDKFGEEIRSLEKEEKNTAHAFELMMQYLTGQFTGAKESKERRSTTRGKRLQYAAQSKDELNDVTRAKAADEKYLADLKSECSLKADDYGKRQQLRLEEIDAIEKATEILSSSDVAGAADQHMPAFIQLKSNVRSGSGSSSSNPSDGNSQIQQRVAQFLQDKALTLGSKTLALV